MKKGGKYVLMALGTILFVAVVALLIADRRYQFLFAGPVVSHDTAVTPNTRVLIVAKPPLSLPLVAKVLGSSAPPAWILDRVIPYESALIVDPDLSVGSIGVTLFVNSQRLTPLIRDAANAYSMPSKVPYVAWSSGTFDSSKLGVLSLTGSMPIDAATSGAVKSQWGVVQLFSPAPFDGNHLIELSVDNRDGSLYTLLSTFANAQLLTLPMSADSMRKTIAPVATMSIQGDLRGDDEMAVRLVIECQPTAEPGEVTGVSFAIAGAFGELVKLVQQRGASLTGEKRTEGQTITGDYTLKNVSALIR